MRFLLHLFLLNLSLANACGQSPLQWEKNITAFEDSDKTLGYMEGGILFMGSSSIALWDSLAADMAPYPFKNRGFGGSNLSDVLHYSDRILGQHRPCAFVLLVANDITGHATIPDKQPEEVAFLYRRLLLKIREKHPNTPVFILAITPTVSRWNVWPAIREANAAIDSMCKTMHKVTFVKTEHLFLRPDGLPNDSLFKGDALHLNRAGYTTWTNILKPALQPIMHDCKR